MKEIILMIEDNPNLLRINSSVLRNMGYRVYTAQTLADGNNLVREVRPDLILLDILLPDGNGLEYCRERLDKRSACVLFLSALNTKDDVIAGLRAGGDDYISKPYLMEEMLARIEALLRRRGIIEEQRLRFGIGSLSLNQVSMHAYHRGRDLMLTPMEYKLLELLLNNKGQYLRAKTIYEQLWDMNAVDTRPVKQLARRLREKLLETEVVIEAAQGKGYRIVEKQKGS